MIVSVCMHVCVCVCVCVCVVIEYALCIVFGLHMS